MILLAFLLPFSIYLFLLGSINRRRHPVMVSGVMDFIGILFAASGFLLFVGPGILSSLNDRWRQFWLLGQKPGGVAEGFWQFWIFLSVLYFLVILTVSGLVLRNQRHLTSVYNADPELIQRCLIRVCEQMGLDPVRSGSLFVFGVEPVARRGVEANAGIQSEPGSKIAKPAKALLEQTAVMEMETFTRMRHVTLRWEPAGSTLRRAIEAELAKALAETRVEPSELGIWLTMTGVTLFGLTLIAGITLVAIRLYL